MFGLDGLCSMLDSGMMAGDQSDVLALAATQCRPLLLPGGWVNNHAGQNKLGCKLCSPRLKRHEDQVLMPYGLCFVQAWSKHGQPVRRGQAPKACSACEHLQAMLLYR